MNVSNEIIRVDAAPDEIRAMADALCAVADRLDAAWDVTKLGAPVPRESFYIRTFEIVFVLDQGNIHRPSGQAIPRKRT